MLTREGRVAAREVLESETLLRVDYLELVDWAGRHMRAKQTGHIVATTPPILLRLALDPPQVMDFLNSQSDLPVRALGTPEQLRRLARSVGLKFLHGVTLAKRLSPNSG